MKTTKWTNYSLVMAGLLLFNVACSDSNSDSRSEATIRGSVEQSSLSQSMTDKSGTSEVMNSHEATKSDVYAARVTESGETQKIEDSETQTDDQGRFTLTVDMAAAQRVIIVAERNGQTLRGFVDTSVENGMSYSMKPLNVESSVETEVYIQVVKNGKANHVSKADIDMAVGTSAAASMRAHPGAVAQLAVALGRAAEARAQFVGAKVQSNASAALSKVAELHAKAQLEYESRISGNVSSSDQRAAFEAMIDATLSAYTEAGLSAADASAFVDLWTRVTMSGLSSMPSEVRNRLYLRLAFLKAAAMDKFIRIQAQLAGFSSSTQQAIVQAGIKLRTSISASVSTASEIESAFETWKNEVKHAIESDNSVEATGIISLNAEINAAAGASTVFHAALHATTNTSAVTTAYVTFSDTVKQLLRARIQSGSESRVEAATGILMMVNF
jgi:hypothetical protein